ncbi:uncharacterized protein BDV14DRAFT_3667 [Aspergillus stella-maris]|uniref:uncharacterized protein n=1 Tax=Aspergillus stella-maris TaxID=1810926 RepID=UPI003CCCC746
MAKMASFSTPSAGLSSEPDSNTQPQGDHDNEADDLHRPPKPIASNVNFASTFALMRAVVELRMLQTTTSVLRITRTNPVSITDPNSAICRAMDRREQRISNLVDSMTRDEFERSVREIASQIEVAAAEALPIRELTPSELVEEFAIIPEGSEDDGDGEGELDIETSREDDERFLRVSSPVASTTSASASASLPASMPKRNTLVSEDAVPVVDENVRGGIGDILGDGGKERATCVSSSGPTPGSGSNYSSLERSLSATNVQSATSVAKQCKIVSAAQYTKIVAAGKDPSFSAVNHPYSIDSLVAESPRFDRSMIELNEHVQQKSADSFPGEFPISEGLEFSALATAKHHSRIPSIRTSVRPFSDL